MKINSNSLSARLYVWFYNLEFYQDLPKNLCPFFWKLVIAYVLVIPLFLINLPGIIFNKINNQKMNHEGSLYGVTIVMYIGIFLSLSLLSVPFALIINHIDNSHSGFLHTLQITGVTAIIAGIAASFYLLCSRIKSRIQKKLKNSKHVHQTEEKTPNILAEFIKAKYNKYCPSIEWENLPEKKSHEETHEDDFYY